MFANENFRGLEEAGSLRPGILGSKRAAKLEPFVS